MVSVFPNQGGSRGWSVRQAGEPIVPKKNSLTWAEMILALHEAFSQPQVCIEQVEMILLSYESNPADWEKYVMFDPCKYTRNLVDAGNGLFNLMTLCWSGDTKSSVHDHSGAHCFMKILSGSLVETKFAWPESQFDKSGRLLAPGERPFFGADKDGNFDLKCATTKNFQGETVLKEPLVQIGQRTARTNQVVYINDEIGLHRVSNSSPSEGAISLHVYSPPFDKCRVFDANTGKSMTAPVTFWSVYGNRADKPDPTTPYMSSSNSPDGSPVKCSIDKLIDLRKQIAPNPLTTGSFSQASTN